MKKIIPFLLICCLLVSACASPGKATVKSGGNPKKPASEAGLNEDTGDAQDTKEPEAFSLYPAYLQLPLGQHLTLDAEPLPAGKKLTWASSNPSVADVDENGRITPIAEGEAIITAAFADNASVTAACGVLVVADGNIYLWDEKE